MNIAILGGSFDPPHNGHLLIAQEVLKHLPIDQVLLMPSYIHPFQKQSSPANDRFMMTKLLESDRIKISNLELQKKSISYTIDTLNELSVIYPKTTFYWIIGSDQLAEFHKWKNWREIVEKYGLIVFPRQNAKKHIDTLVKNTLKIETIPGNVIPMNQQNLSVCNISSTEIRKKVKRGEQISSLVPKKVANYIDKHRLYT